jgi:transposase
MRSSSPTRTSAPMYATRTRKVKTDRRDARALAEACVLGAYRRAHRLSDPQRHVRGRLLVRDALVRTRTRYISLIRALLRQQGYRVPSGSAEAFATRVRAALALPGPLLSLIAPLLAIMRTSTASSRIPTRRSSAWPRMMRGFSAGAPSPASGP